MTSAMPAIMTFVKRPENSMNGSAILAGILPDVRTKAEIAPMDRIKLLVDKLQLEPHPEGGYYAETYRSRKEISTLAGPRSIATSIYFLLIAGNFSAFHRIKSDEGWHHYEGGPVHLHVLYPNGNYASIILGKDIEAGEVQQTMVPAGCWFASEVAAGNEYALVGCTVSPGFDFADFELADAKTLEKAFPFNTSLIARLTR